VFGGDSLIIAYLYISINLRKEDDEKRELTLQYANNSKK